MTLQNFIHEIFAVSHASSICGVPVVKRITPTSVNLRIPIANFKFIEVFYNEQTRRTAFTLIENQQRIFGADNTGDWHIHPFHDPNAHEPLEEPLPFAEFVRLIEHHEQMK